MDRCLGLPRLILRYPKICAKSLVKWLPCLSSRRYLMIKYLKTTGHKRVPGTRKLLGLMRAEKILLYTPALKWYLDHGMKVTAFYQFLKYARGGPFECFPEEIADVRRQADKDPNKRIAGDTAKLKGKSFYGKIIEDLARHAITTFTRGEKEVDAALQSPYLEDLEEIGNAYELRRGKHKCTIDRPYQCGIAVYQLAKLRMLEFYYDFLDKYVNCRDFEYIYMDTDSAYFAIFRRRVERCCSTQTAWRVRQRRKKLTRHR
ncbi:uncharacterized protein LOC130654548 [Hydractinia symbiolongicarpus]|uniref:uncharacterized protein LOC130654548 n=1 Tax=Hydractinia symbiolongicarpus TaxID=13093 RepID=UPI00254CF7C9|nr:uncharacterized protein LOC130654548 [Hydractinia symbiolongicarpus]